MFQRILVPVDFSEQNQRSLEIAVEIAARAGGTVYLLHVIEMIADTSFEDFRDFYLSIEREAAQKMEQLRQRIAENAANLDHAILYGNRVRDILRVADEQSADLIIMNSHRIDLSDPTKSWGTISYKVSMLANCPVMLVK